MSRKARVAHWLGLLALLSLGLAAWIGPVLYVQPFRPQSTAGLDRALAVRELAPVVTVVLALAAIVLVVRLWSGGRWWRRIPLVLASLVAIAPALLTRWNHFETMFSPLEAPAYASVADAASFVGKDDMVLSVVAGGESAAYPVRQMAHHHLVGDVVGGVPIVATY
jgi:hypothetical protein